MLCFLLLPQGTSARCCDTNGLIISEGFPQLLNTLLSSALTSLPTYLEAGKVLKQLHVLKKERETNSRKK